MSVPDQTASTDDPVAEVIVAFLDTARALFSGGEVEYILRDVVDLAIASIDGCDFAGIFLREESVITTWLETDPIVSRIDAIQGSSGEGPGIDAILEGGALYADDLAADDRWPTFGPQAATRGIRSVIALKLFGDETLGTLNLYGIYPRAFGVIDRGKALILAGFAGAAISAERRHQAEKRRIDDLHEALMTREIIGQAQGILIEREGITADAAFDILRRASQHLNRKLREVAQDLVDTGEAPEADPTTRVVERFDAPTSEQDQ